MTGAGGTGKSFVIDCLTKFTRLRYGRTIGEFGAVLLIARTGGAAINIDGFTWQSAHGIRLVILDEISMVPAEYLYDIHLRLCAAFNVPDDIDTYPFAAIHFLASGDNL